MTLQLALPTDAVRTYCRTRPLRRLSVFGSALRADFNAGSDVDLLVEYLPGSTVTLIDMAQQEIDLGAMIGRKVDLRTLADLSPYFRQTVLDAAQSIYRAPLMTAHGCAICLTRQ